ncbi:MAG: response regulator [Lachnospiraceae bacterium]|nr:response regulator [Lachnospiraceae bacterium]MBQ4068753.1 response regulator [Lachnospiraceae bacterium]
MNISDMKILVCDDSILSRKKFKDCIVNMGCTEIYEAADGEEVVNVYKEVRPTLVFMDIVMPKKDGIDAVKDIIAFDPNAKIVMASSVGTQSFLKDAIKAGATDFLQKPIDGEQVKRLIENFLQGGN